MAISGPISTFIVAAAVSMSAAVVVQPEDSSMIQVNVARDESMPMEAVAAAGAREAQVGVLPGCAAAALVPLLICSAAGLAFCFLHNDDDEKQKLEGASTHSYWSAWAQGVADAASAGTALCVESAIAASIVPLLPHLSRGGDPVLLYSTRPIVGAAAALLLPLALRAGRHRGRLIAAAGLLGLGASCMVLALCASPATALLARIVGAAASACIIVPIFHTVMLQSPADIACWRMGAMLYGSATGAAIGPWVGGALAAQWGAPVAVAIMAAACEVSCLLYLGACIWIVERPAVVQLGHPLEGGLTSTIFTAAAETLGDPKRCALLVGVGLSVAVLSVHAALVPAFLDGQDWSAGSADLAAAEGLAQAGLALSVLMSAACADALGERWVVCGMVVSNMLNIIGIRCILAGHASVQPFIAALGLLASQSGVGGYLGLALPLLLRATCGPSALPTAPAAAVSSGTLGVALLAGDGVGVFLQRMLLPALGQERTLLAFAVLLAGHVCLMLIVPGWVRAGSGQKPSLLWPQRRRALV